MIRPAGDPKLLRAWMEDAALLQLFDGTAVRGLSLPWGRSCYKEKSVSYREIIAKV